MIGLLFGPACGLGQSRPPCAQHARDCPAPPVVDAGPGLRDPAPAPSDAIVLFDGKDLSRWRGGDEGPARWKIDAGYVEVAPGTGMIHTAEGFGDLQLHLEWATPDPPRGTDQNRGNSGVFLMGRYEVQILDSYGSATSPDGQAGAVYGQFPPLVNPSRKPGEWQSYDIVFRRPRFGPAGELLRPAIITVWYNGVLVQDQVTLTGPTGHQRRPLYQVHPDRLPIGLQDHEHPLRFRNIWVRKLEQ
jgi:hypothetical protein